VLLVMIHALTCQVSDWQRILLTCECYAPDAHVSGASSVSHRSYCSQLTLAHGAQGSVTLVVTVVVRVGAVCPLL
jgi:hypothetical protein